MASVRKIIRIVTENLHYIDLLRQLPDHIHELNDFHFTLDREHNCDGLIVLDYTKEDVSVNCIPENVWLWNMEPPDEEWEWLRKGYKHFAKVITVDHNINHSKIIHNQLAIPWQINKTFSELMETNYFDKKEKDLSFITSNYKARKGHHKRLIFLNKIKGQLNFDLWGRGFNAMEDKSDGLLPYKYSIVIENSTHKDYWSEKIADAFLCGCLPIYYGCPNIDDYFDPQSFIKIDIDKPVEAIQIIKNAIQNNEWEKRKHFIEEARRKILNEYHFFPVFQKLFAQYGNPSGKKENIFIPLLSHHPSQINPMSVRRNFYLLKKIFLKKRYLNLESPLFGFTTYK